MVGEYVPEDNEYWRLYIKLRDIINIITSPNIIKSHLLQLQLCIEEHHELYIKLFGFLTAKFHLLIHYVQIMLKNGPVISVSAMRFESKHREIKAILQSTSCKKNILKTVGIRHQLSLMHNKFSKYDRMYIAYGPELNDTVNAYFPTAQTIKLINNITINDVKYSAGIIIVANICKDGPCFGKIDKIFVVDDNIFFTYMPYKIIGFNYHYYAHSVIADETIRKIDYDSMTTHTPCILSIINNVHYIATRHIL